METASLVEPNMKHLLGSALRQCHETKNVYYENVINVILFVGFIAIVLFILSIKPGRNPKDDKRMHDLMTEITAVENMIDKPPEGELSGLPIW
jgi:hypothetical protein